eukprot:Tamp_01206.p1 GENE.Tamp_01206~~Tamp_01206.p1  ORF type:complete len:927 (-),score=119.26 Tamp_01206:2960-5590(-)
MPLEELLTLPVPPLFLAVDEQEKRRSTRREDLGAHDASRDPAAAQGMLRASPLAPTQPHLPPLRQLPTPDDAGRFRNDFAERPDTIWRGPAAAAPQRQSCDDIMLSPDASHSTIAADDRDGHNDFAAVRAAQAVTPATERSPQDHHARPRVLAYRSAMPSALSPASSPDAEKSDAAETLGVSEDRSESEVVMGCLRMSAPPSLGFLLGGAGALRTDAPTPALARKATPANNGVPGDDELQEIDPLEASMLLDKLFKKVAFQPQPTRAAAPAPWATAPPGAGLLAEAAGHAGREGVGGMIQEANEEIAADIARRCVFDTSPPANDKRIRQSCHDRSPSSSPVHLGTREACFPAESLAAPLHQARQSLSCERVVQGASEKGLIDSAANNSTARVGAGVRRVACAPGMARASGVGRKGEDEGVAGVEKVFRARCSTLRAMVAAVKEASERLAQAAALRHYADADVWSQEVKSRRSRTEDYAQELLQALMETERSAVSQEHYGTAQACQDTASLVKSAMEQVAGAATPRDPVEAVFHDPVLAACVLAEEGQRQVVALVGRIGLPRLDVQRWWPLCLVVLATVVCFRVELFQSCEYTLSWLWSGATSPMTRRQTGEDGRQRLVSHACAFSRARLAAPASNAFAWGTPETSAGHAFAFPASLVNAAPWRGASDKSAGRDENERAADALFYRKDASHTPPAAFNLVDILRFVTPYLLVAMGSVVLETLVLVVLRMSLAYIYGIQGEVPRTKVKYLHVATVVLVSATCLPFPTLTLVVLPLSTKALIVGNAAGKMTGALAHACLAWLLWVQSPGATLSTWLQRDASIVGQAAVGGFGALISRVAHAALSPCLSASHLQRLVELEGVCREGRAGDGGMRMPAWIG